MLPRKGCCIAAGPRLGSQCTLPATPWAALSRRQWQPITPSCAKGCVQHTSFLSSSMCLAVSGMMTDSRPRHVLAKALLTLLGISQWVLPLTRQVVFLNATPWWAFNKPSGQVTAEAVASAAGPIGGAGVAAVVAAGDVAAAGSTPPDETAGPLPDAGVLLTCIHLRHSVSMCVLC